MNNRNTTEDTRRKSILQAQDFYDMKKDNFRQLRKISVTEISRNASVRRSASISVAHNKNPKPSRYRSRTGNLLPDQNLSTSGSTNSSPLDLDMSQLIFPNIQFSQLNQNFSNPRDSMTSNSYSNSYSYEYNRSSKIRDSQVRKLDNQKNIDSVIEELISTVNNQVTAIDDSRILECISNELILTKWGILSNSQNNGRDGDGSDQRTIKQTLYLNRFRAIQELITDISKHNPTNSSHENYENLHPHVENYNPIEILICVEFISGPQINYKAEAMSAEHKKKAAKILDKWRQTFLANSMMKKRRNSSSGIAQKKSEKEVALWAVQKWKNKISKSQRNSQDSTKRSSDGSTSDFYRFSNNNNNTKNLQNKQNDMQSHFNRLNLTVKKQILNGKKPYQNTTQLYQGTLNGTNKEQQRVLLPFDSSLILSTCTESNSILYEVTQLSDHASWEYFEQGLSNGSRVTFYLLSDCKTEITHIKSFISLVWRILRYSVNEWMKITFSFNASLWHGCLDNTNEDLINFYALYYGLNIFEKRVIYWNLSVLQFLQMKPVAFQFYSQNFENNSASITSIGVAAESNKKNSTQKSTSFNTGNGNLSGFCAVSSRIASLTNQLSAVHTAYKNHDTNIFDILNHFGIVCIGLIEYCREQIVKLMEFRYIERESILEKVQNNSSSENSFLGSPVGRKNSKNQQIRQRRVSSALPVSENFNRRISTNYSSSPSNNSLHSMASSEYEHELNARLECEYQDMDQQIQETLKNLLSILRTILSSNLYTKAANISKFTENEINHTIKSYLKLATQHFSFLDKIDGNLNLRIKLEKAEQSMNFFMGHGLSYFFRDNYKFDIKEVARQGFILFINEKCQHFIDNFDPKLNSTCTQAQTMYEYLVDFQHPNFSRQQFDNCRYLFISNDTVRAKWLLSINEVLFLLEPGCDYRDFINKIDFIHLMFKSYWISPNCAKFEKSKNLQIEIFTSFLQYLSDLCVIFHQYNSSSMTNEILSGTNANIDNKNNSSSYYLNFCAKLINLYKSCEKTKYLISELCRIAGVDPLSERIDKFIDPVKESKRFLESKYLENLKDCGNLKSSSELKILQRSMFDDLSNVDQKMALEEFHRKLESCDLS